MGLACGGRQVGGTGRKMKPANGRGIPRVHGSQALVPAHLGTEGSVRGRDGGRGPYLGALQLRGGVSGGQAQPYPSGRSPGGPLGGGGGGVPNLSGSPFSRPALGEGDGWAWDAQDRPDLWDPGP